MHAFVSELTPYPQMLCKSRDEIEITLPTEEKQRDATILRYYTRGKSCSGKAVGTHHHKWVISLTRPLLLRSKPQSGKGQNVPSSETRKRLIKGR